MEIGMVYDITIPSGVCGVVYCITVRIAARHTATY